MTKENCIGLFDFRIEEQPKTKKKNYKWAVYEFIKRKGEVKEEDLINVFKLEHVQLQRIIDRLTKERSLEVRTVRADAFSGKLYNLYKIVD